MRRIEQEELLDSAQVSAMEVERNLQDLRAINRYLGGSALHALLLRRVVDRSGSRSLHILEVAAGRGDVLHVACTQLRLAGVETHITLLDRRACHLPRRGDWDAPLPEPELLTGDALRLPLADCSVDVVSCCLFLHHLNVREVAQFLAEALRVARVAVVLNDLERSRRHWLLALAGRLFYRSSLSCHDGPVSVRRAYTHAELCALLQAAEQPFETYRGFLFRIGAVVWKIVPASNDLCSTSARSDGAIDLDEAEALTESHPLHSIRRNAFGTSA